MEPMRIEVLRQSFQPKGSSVRHSVHVLWQKGLMIRCRWRREVPEASPTL